MNTTPAGNHRWHQSFHKVGVCGKCGVARWPMEDRCLECGERVASFEYNILQAKGQLVSFSWFYDSWEEEDRIVRVIRIVGLMEGRVRFKGKDYKLRVLLPFCGGTKKEKVKVGSEVEVVLRRGLKFDENDPIIYWPKLRLKEKA